MKNTNKTLRIATVCTVLAGSMLFVQSAFAKTNTLHTNSLPGWGFGDENHIHIGPPGLSDRLDDLFKNEQDQLNSIFKQEQDFLTEFFNNFKNLFG